MILTSEKGTSRDALKSMNMKMLSMTIKPLLCSAKKTQERNDIQDEIILLHISLAKKIQKIQMEVDRSFGQFFNGSIPWSPQI